MQTPREIDRMVERDRESKFMEEMIYGAGSAEVLIEVDDEDDRTLCDYCGDWEVDEKHIYYVVDGKVKCCCETCFFGMINEDYLYDDALMILQNRLGNNTGILAVDLFSDRMIEELKKANEAHLRRNSALYEIEMLRKVGA